MASAIAPKVINTEMQAIKSWEDVAPFAGRVVAYMTDSSYIGSVEGYRLDLDRTVRFGCVDQRPRRWDCGEQAYGMARLLNFKEFARNCALVNSVLQSTSMRLATNAETRQIEEIINTDQAEFEYFFKKEEINAILERHIKLLNELFKEGISRKTLWNN